MNECSYLLSYICVKQSDVPLIMIFSIIMYHPFLLQASLVLNVSKEEGGPKTSLRQQPFGTPG